MSVISFQQKQFGTLETGQSVTCYSLRNPSGMTVNLLNYGATLNSVQIPDSRDPRKMHEITLGSHQLTDYETGKQLSGATFLSLPSSYESYPIRIHQALWEAESTTQDEAATVMLSLSGTLTHPTNTDSIIEYKLHCEYTLTASNELIIRSHTELNKALPLFMTHHPIWSLSTNETDHISDQILQIWAASYSKLNAAGFKESDNLSVQEHPAFDFQKPQRIGEKCAQIADLSDYNICYTLEPNENTTSNMQMVARVKAPVSGRTLEVITNQRGLHFYLKGKTSTDLEGFCLSPMPLTLDSLSDTTAYYEQETRYKLIW
jgi:aldose 1-epimerase